MLTQFVKDEAERLHRHHLLHGVIDGLIRADLAMWEHSLRVSALVGYLVAANGANTMGVCEAVKAGLLHDVGKAALSRSILLNTGHLTQEEWEDMQRHPQLGHQLLLPLQARCPELTEPVMQAVLYHHERENGAGYSGLQAQEIPDLAAAVAVADVWDAVSQPRAYRPAYRHEKAVAIVRTSHLRAKYVNALLELVHNSLVSSG